MNKPLSHQASPHILVLAFSNLDSDPRVQRQISALATRFRVSSCGLRSPTVPVERHYSIPAVRRGTRARVMALMSLLARRFESYYWTNPMVQEALRLLAGERFSAVVANDLDTLPLALRIAGESPVLFDAHEYAPDEFGDRALWRALYGPYTDTLCRKYIARAARAVTVSDGLARLYSERYGISMGCITNAAVFHERPPKPSVPGRVRLVHHGAAIRSRRIEDMISMMALLDKRFTLDLILTPGSRGYIDELRQRATRDARIRLLPPVPMERIVDTCSEYDVGLCFFPPVNRSLEFCLPNKFFEYLQARIAVATGPSPEVARIVRQFQCGVIADGFEPAALAAALASLSKESLDAMKVSSGRAAAVHNAQSNARAFVALVEEMLEGEGHRCAY